MPFHPASQAYALGVEHALKEAGLLKQAIAINPRLLATGAGAAAGAGIGAAADKNNRWRGALVGGVGGGALGYGASTFAGNRSRGPMTPPAAPRPAAPVAPVAAPAATPSAAPHAPIDSLKQMPAPEMAAYRHSYVGSEGPATPAGAHSALHADLNKIDPAVLKHQHGTLGHALSQGVYGLGPDGPNGPGGTFGAMHIGAHPELSSSLMKHVISPTGEYNAHAHGAIASMMEGAKQKGIALTPQHIDAMATSPMYRQLMGGNASLPPAALPTNAPTNVAAAPRRRRSDVTVPQPAA